jgi:uncharacterized coiled-coil DUF342 family protein
MIVSLVAAFGLWGCAQGPSSHSATQAEKVRNLESKNAKLEEDYRAVASARDQARKRLSALEEEHAKLQKDLDLSKVVAKERDELREQINARTTERDAVQARCDRLKKGLQTLLGQEEGQGPTLPPPVSAVTETKPAG